MNPQNGQTPLDYLNQIAPKQQKKPLFALNLRSVLIVGIGLIIIVIILSVIASAVSSGRKTPWQHLSARITATQTIANNATGKLKSSQLRSINSDLKIALTNTERELAPVFTSMGVDTKKLPEKVLAAESADETLARLETGRLNAKYDSTYAREMNFQVSRVLALYQEIFSSTNSTNTKELINTAYADLAPSQKALTDYTSTKE